MKNSLKLLILIVVIATFFRLLFVATNPPALTWDEAAWGYNAYSLGIDGKDEFGKLLPVSYLESFGDFKPPLYAYLAVLPVKLFGLNEFSTRLPSVLFGIGTVVATYFLVLQIFGQDKKKEALFSSFILSISPWHIMLSRAAFEANVSTFFIVFGVYLFLKGINEKAYFMFFAMLSFVCSLYTFNSARVVAPILVLIFSLVFYKRIIKNLKIVLVSVAVGFVICLPLMIFLASPQAKLRFNEVNIFSDITVIERTNQQIQNDNNSAFSKLIHNRRLAYAVEYIRHYFDNLTPKYLFISGDGNPKFSIQDVGQFYLWEAPFLVLGLLYLFRKRVKHWWVVPVVIVVAIIPAGFARETPHALRTEAAIPYFQIVSALGVLFALDYLKKWRKLGVASLGLIISIGVIYFAHNLFNHYQKDYSREWQYGYKEAIEYVSEVEDQYEKVYTTDVLGRPYIYYLLYLKYDPVRFRNDSDVFRESFGFVHVTRFGKYYFPKNLGQIKDKNALFIGASGDVPQDARILKKFYLLNGRESLVAYTL